MPRIPLLLAAPAALALSACMHTGTIKGDFACKAPNGTCAPMSNIDEGAVAKVGASMTAAAGDQRATTSGLDTLLRAVPLEDGAVPGRTSDRVLKVVFPASVDSSGIYRDQSVAYAVMERGTWTGRPAQVAATPAGREVATASAAPASLDDIVAQAPSAIRPTGPAVPINPSTAYTYPGQPVAPTVAYAAPQAAFAAGSLREAMAAAAPPPDTSAVEQVADAVPDADASAAAPARRRVKWKGHWYWLPARPSSTGRAERAAAPGRDRSALAQAQPSPLTTSLNARALRAFGPSSAPSSLAAAPVPTPATPVPAPDALSSTTAPVAASVITTRSAPTGPAAVLDRVRGMAAPALAQASAPPARTPMADAALQGSER